MKCYRLDVFDGSKKIDSEVVTKSKLDHVVRNFEEDGYTVRKKTVDCD